MHNSLDDQELVHLIAKGWTDGIGTLSSHKRALVESSVVVSEVHAHPHVPGVGANCLSTVSLLFSTLPTLPTPPTLPAYILYLLYPAPPTLPAYILPTLPYPTLL